MPGAARTWWLVIGPDEVDVCDADPGHQVTATIETDLRTLTRVWLGDLAWTAATRTGDLVVQASPSVRWAVPRWFNLSSFASVPRPVAAVGLCGGGDGRRIVTGRTARFRLDPLDLAAQPGRGH